MLRRCGRISLKRSCCSGLPMNTIGPSEEISRRMARPSVVLPEPDFADHTKRFALADLDADAVDRLDVADRLAHDAALDRKPDFQIVGFQHHRAGGIGLQGVRARLGGEQRARIGMLRRLEDFGDSILLDDLAVLHHADAVGDPANDAEVVGDEQHGHAETALQILEKLEDLRLNRDVQGGRRLVRDQQIRLIGERHGDHHALTLAAGHLVRIGARAGSRDWGFRPASAAR